MVKLIEHGPKAGTIRHTVWEGLGQDKSLREIRQENNYGPKQVYAAATKVIDPSDRHLIKQEWLDHKPELNRTAAESIFPHIGPFVGMWMVTLEIQRAMVATYGVTYEYSSIQDTSATARQTAYMGLRRFSKDELTSLRKEALHQHKDEIPARVAQWLDTAAVLLTHPSHTVPTSRKEWINLIQEYKRIQLINNDNTTAKWLSVVSLYYENNRSLPVNWSTEGLEEEREFIIDIEKKRQQEEDVSAWKMFAEQEKIEFVDVKTLLSRVAKIINGKHWQISTSLQYALAFFLYVREESAKGDFNRTIQIGGRFSTVLDTFSPQDQEALKEPMQLIIQATQAAKKKQIE